ncbi:phage tail tape measure protein [Shimia sediminis]|uniref:phage tail tape measure protein n=1 Tax=Shimia sediminis TaxID=2497945 RepID=UPI000F8DC039|nr:phage tail tape measure protein [Shimia sediminis]
MSDKEQLIVQLEARVWDFEKKMKRAERTGTRSYKHLRGGSRSATRQMERDMLRSTTSINKALATTSTKIGVFSKAMAAGLAGSVVTAAFAGISSNINDTIKGIAVVGDEAKRSGLDAKTFQEWAFVAKQNRIEVDALVDGFKELNIRADEFIVTSKGPAEEAFRRLGFSAKKLKNGLKDPSKLMMEIIRRMEELDKAAQIRVADEVFGGTAGERFVELLGQGEGKLRDTIRTAHDVGAVFDEEMIAKADELDRKFQALQTRMGRFGKEIAVAFAEGIEGILSAKDDLDGIFGEADRGRAVLGSDITEQLEGSEDLLKKHAKDLRELHATYDELFGLINRMTGPDGVRVFEIDNEEVRFALADVMAGLKESVDQLENGQIEASEFENEVVGLVEEADALAKELASIDEQGFSGVIEAIGGIGAALRRVIDDSRTLKAELPGSTDGEITYGPQRRGSNRPTSKLAPKSSIRPRLPSVDASFDVDDDPSGGGGSRADEYEREAAAIRERTAALEAEAAALIASAASGGQYGQSLEYARKRAELLLAAQKAGKEITPELQAEIDALAEAYVNAGDAADDAANKLEQMEDAAERGADAMTDVFGSILDGSKSAKEAVVDLLMEMAKMQLLKGISGIFGGAGGGGFLEGLLGFASGGYTGVGAKHQVAGVVHKGEYVVNAGQVKKPGVLGLLEAINNGAPGFAQGGLVPGCEGGPELIVERKTK